MLQRITQTTSVVEALFIADSVKISVEEVPFLASGPLFLHGASFLYKRKYSCSLIPGID